MKIVRAVVSLVAGISCMSIAAYATDPLPRSVPEEVGMSSDRLALIGKAVNAEIAAGQLPGAVVGIVRRGKLVFFEAFGYRDKVAGTAMTTDSIFSIASMTKPMVAVGALQLYEQGRLLMDEPLAKYFPQFSNMQVAILGGVLGTIGKVPAARQITIRDLFRHTSGLGYGGGGRTLLHKMYPLTSLSAAQVMTGPEFIDRLSSLPLMSQPGTAWEYGFGLDVLGLALESISQEPLGQYLTKNVWEPLGMTDTSFAIAANKMPLYAKSLPADPETGRSQLPRPLINKFDCGGSCAVSTAGDYLRFAWMLVNKGTFGDVQLLASKTVEYMLSDQLGPDIKRGQMAVADYSNYGFGLSVAVRTTLGTTPTLGLVGDFSWAGANGTSWWGNQREQLAAVWMASVPGAGQRKFNRMISALVNQAIVD